MAWEKLRKLVGGNGKKEMPSGLWMRCDRCKSMVYKRKVEMLRRVCPDCSYHFPLPGNERVDLLLDTNSFQELWPDLESTDPLTFTARDSYVEKIKSSQKKSGLKDAILTGTATIYGRRVAYAATDSRFLMGSMGAVVGEKLTRLYEYALEKKLPIIMVSGSGGGARMYEGAISLMQMAKTSAAIARLSDAGGIFISILTHPTMAGVLASFASLGDVIIAEPGALIGFTGPRVIAETINAELPKGFQTSEFLLEHGFLDRIVSRADMRKELITLLGYLGPSYDKESFARHEQLDRDQEAAWVKAHETQRIEKQTAPATGTTGGGEGVDQESLDPTPH